MTYDETSAESHAGRARLLPNGSLVLLTAAVALLMSLNRRNPVALVAIAGLGTILAPLLYVVSRRFLRALQRRETERRMIMQTRDYLRTQEACEPRATMETGDGLGRRMTPQGFKDVFSGVAALLPEAKPVSFGALALRGEDRTSQERRLEDLPAMQAAPVSLPFRNLLADAAGAEAGS